MKKIYLDYAAGMPVDLRVIEAMQPYFFEKIGNPSSVHSSGSEAKNAIEGARKKVAELVGAGDKEIIFTSGATESNNLAIQGIAYRNEGEGKHIITTRIEHMSVINPCKYLAKKGFKITYVPVDSCGIVDVEKLKAAITEETILISVMYANSEIGTIEPIKEIGEIARSADVYFHVDSTAAAGKIPIDVEKENIDLLTISSNDIYGPRGVGALYIRKGTSIASVMPGGGQERGLRSGTENVAGIVGFGKAAEIAKVEMHAEGDRLAKLRDRFINGVLKKIPYSYLNGHPTKRLPNNVALRFSFVEGEAMILHLDMLGIAASTGSACTSKTLEPSHVLTAIGLAHEDAHGSLLFTLGRQTAEEDITYVLEVLPDVVKKLRAMSPFTPPELRQL